MKRFLLILGLLATACGSGDRESVFTEPAQMAIDSTNSRLFVFEREGALVLINASNRDKIGDQPRISRKRNEELHALLPTGPTHAAAIAVGSTTRLFVTGAQTITGGTQVLNQIFVLDYDGSGFEEASFSPITVEDGNGATDDTDNLIGGLVVDASNSRLYVTDSSAQQLYVFDTSTGAQPAGPVAIAGFPNRMSLNAGRLYVANSSENAAEQVVTVVNTADLTTTAIDFDFPTDDVSVLSNGSGTVMLARVARTQRVLVRSVDTATFANSTPVTAGDSSVETGEITNTNRITSSIGNVLLAANSDGGLFGYVTQADGDIAFLSFAADLSSYTGDTLETTGNVLTHPTLYSNGTTNTVYMIADASGELVYTGVGRDSVGLRF